MSGIQICVRDHLLIPFGVPKWDISKIKIAGVSTQGTYFVSDAPFVYIDKTKREGIRLRNVHDVFPESVRVFPQYAHSPIDGLAAIATHIKTYCEMDTSYETRFLDRYIDYLVEVVKPQPWELGDFNSLEERRSKIPAPRNDEEWMFDALFPIPQAHLYLHDPLREGYSFLPDNMFKVDFAFWTGKRLVGVEIDGSSHIGNRDHIRKDRLMQRAGVQVIHIMNHELQEFGTKVISRLLPREITSFWKYAESSYRFNPVNF